MTAKPWPWRGCNTPTLSRFTKSARLPARPSSPWSLSTAKAWRAACTAHRCRLAQAAALVEILARAMHYAHEKGVIHRDLKPSNIMMRPADGTVEPVIVDFGLARCIEPGSARLTASGLSIGTWQYMTPEQLCGEPDALGPGCDIYALGVIMYELLTGRLPFDAPGQVVRGNPAPPSSCRADVDPRLEAICLKAMAASSAARYASMGDLAWAPGGLLAFETCDGWSGQPGAEQCGQGRHDAGSDGARPAACRRGCHVPGPDAGAGALADGTPAQRVTKSTRVAIDRSPPPARPRVWSNQLVVTGIAFALITSRNRVRGRRGSSRAYRGRNRTTRPSNRRLTRAGLSGYRKRSLRSEVRSLDEPFPPTHDFRDVVHVGPQRLNCTGPNGVSADDVRRAQEAWAKYLGRDVEENVEIADGVTMTFVLVPPGKFLMGSPPDEEGKNGRYPNETLHEVTLTEPFDLGKYEVTQAQYAALTGKSPSYYKGSDRPVEQVTWDEADAFGRDLTKKLSDRHVYRLATEAEWEYSCRGGRPSSEPFGIGDGRSLTSRDANFNNTRRTDQQSRLLRGQRAGAV